MKVLQFEEVIDFLEKKYDFNHRNISQKNFDSDEEKPYLDFWHWIVFSCDLLSNKDFNQGNYEKTIFILNLKEKLEQQRQKFQKINDLLKSFDFELSLPLIKLMQLFVSEGILLKEEILRDIKNIKDEEDLKKWKDEKYYTEYEALFYLYRNKDRDIQQTLHENNPDWIKKIVHLIDKEYGEYRDENGAYHMKIIYE